MPDNQQDIKMFLEDQYQWVKEQDEILERIEIKLYEMRNIAEYARDQQLSSEERNRLNNQLNELKLEILELRQQLHSSFH